MPTRSLQIDFPLDIRLTLSHLRHGYGDPTIRVARNHAVRATRTPEGPASMQIDVSGERVEVSAWGPGAEWLLDSVPDLIGAHDDPAALVARHDCVRHLQRSLTGLRVGRTGAVVEALVPAVLEQKVTGFEARRSFRALVYELSEPAPGPVRLWLPPDPAVLARTPYYVFHRFGVERRRADVIRSVCARARRVEETALMTRRDAARRLLVFRGVGPWTVAEVASRAFGDADAVPVGDYHLPHLVSWALAGERRGSDERMLELLEPYAGQRGRVIRLLEIGADRPARRSPRARVRQIESF